MKLNAYEISLTLIKGILLGVQENEFIEDDVIEKDFDIYLGLFKITITLIYN
jgi:hypothetical protein